MSARFHLWTILVCAGTFPACFETKVITADSNEEGSGGKGTNTSSGGSGSGATAKACLDCQKNQCATESSKCDSNAGCRALLECVLDCANNANCASGCSTSDVTATTAATNLATCSVQKCTSECYSTPGVGGSGGGGNLGSGGASNGGATTQGNGGTSSAKGGTSGLGGSNGLGGSLQTYGGSLGSGGGATTGITWLSFDKSTAPATLAPNTELGIDGVLYGYTDGCATLTWDEETRCATGSLCSPGPTYANWGAAIGFDFRNTGDEGIPPNTKRTWNPSQYGVKGVAWEITGTAPALQLWVLNMDPIYNGECNSASCDIQGPPDGTASPQLNGQLLFSNMRKDDWGGSGVFYTFDPAAVHALQFKMPSVIAGAAPFAFCVKRVGLVR